MSNSLQNLQMLPSIEQLRKNCQALALLDAILMPEWEYRYFSFNNNWGGQKKEAMASMRNGEGDEYFMHFSSSGVIGKVYSNNDCCEASLLLEKIPDIFSSFKTENAFSLEETTFFFWREPAANCWMALPANAYEYAWLRFLLGDPAFYANWASHYYEKNIDVVIVNEVFKSLSVNEQQLNILNPDLKLHELQNDLQEIFS